jgi:hypothetical protein
MYCAPIRGFHFVHYQAINGKCSVCGRKGKVNLFEKAPLLPKPEGRKGKNGKSNNSVPK